jgi:hypothetical protein
MNKKGFLYTLGLTLFLLAVLSLGILFLRQASLEKQRNIESGFSLKSWDSYTSVNKAVADAFIATGVFLNSTNSTATFAEPLPHDYVAFDAFMELFIDRIEGNFSNINISLKKFYEDRHTICFQPTGIGYQHQGPSDTKEDNIIEINKNSNITSFNITLEFTSPVTCDLPPPGSGTFFMTLKITPTTDANCLAYQNPQSYPTHLVTFTNLTGSTATLQLKPSGGTDKSCYDKTGAKVLTISASGVTALDISESTIVVGYKNPPLERGYFETGIEVSVNDTPYTFYKHNFVIFPLPRQS